VGPPRPDGESAEVTPRPSQSLWACHQNPVSGIRCGVFWPDVFASAPRPSQTLWACHPNLVSGIRCGVFGLMSLLGAPRPSQSLWACHPNLVSGVRCGVFGLMSLQGAPRPSQSLWACHPNLVSGIRCGVFGLMSLLVHHAHLKASEPATRPPYPNRSRFSRAALFYSPFSSTSRSAIVERAGISIAALHPLSNPLFRFLLCLNLDLTCRLPVATGRLSKRRR
jgi:hypothetical protein